MEHTNINISSESGSEAADADADADVVGSWPEKNVLDIFQSKSFPLFVTVFYFNVRSRRLM